METLARPRAHRHANTVGSDHAGAVGVLVESVMTTLKKFFTVVPIVAVAGACAMFELRYTPAASGQTNGTASAASYVTISNSAPLPANFRAYTADSPWNNRLPENPRHVDNLLTDAVQLYAYNTRSVSWRTPADDYLSGCASAAGCGGLGGFPIYKASNSDPVVTFACSAAAAYGCTRSDFPVKSFSIIGHIPANARPGCTVRDTCGDTNMAIIQPDGATLNVYGCVPRRDFQNGDVLTRGGGVCDSLSGMVYASLSRDKGVNSSVTSGPNYEAEVIHYNEVVPEGATINHAINMPVSCTSRRFVYPGSSLTGVCGGGSPNGQGVPTGTRVFLSLSHAQIDSMIASGTLPGAMRPIYYALHDYGGYIVDTAQGDVPLFDAGSGGFYLEDARPWLVNGATNPWVPWFQSQGATLAKTQGGNPFWSFTVNFWQPIAPYLKALSSCYAEASCSDSNLAAAASMRLNP